MAVALVAGVTTLAGLGPGSSGATAPAAARCGPVAQRPWCNTALTPAARANLLEAAMSTTDKLAILTGGASPDVGIPKIVFTDGALGVRGGTGTTSTALPSGTSLAATFNPFDAYLYGTVVGRDAKELGYDGVWGPTVNMMRTPLGGRTYEAYGEDPFLTSATGVGWIEGAQAQGIMADVKHFVANDQEGYLGVPLITGSIGGRLYVNAQVDQRTLHEVYELPFEAAVTQADVATVMCGYNRVNGVFDCENGSLLQQTLEKEWGFKGFVESDAAAAHNTQGNLNNGLDFDIASTGLNAPEVEVALADGQVAMATVNQHVIRILTTLFTFGFFDRAAYADNEGSINRASDDALATWVEEQGITLLQNDDNVLPLRPSSLSSIAVIGSAADTYTRGSGSSQVSPTEIVNPLDGIEAEARADGVSVHYDSGAVPSQAAAAAHGASVAIVVVRDSETEGTDKVCMSLDCPSIGLPDLSTGSDLQVTAGLQDQLIEAVAQANPNTIVVMETGGPVLTPWRNLVKGVVEAWYPGQEGGTALAHVLFGDVDPGGRLPVTFPASPVQEQTFGNPATYPGLLNVDYTEGVFVGYRWFEAHGFTPAYPFGEGLSYSTFSFHDLTLSPGGAGSGTVATVTAQVTNTGSRVGSAVPELYLALPSQPGVPEPPLELKGYQKVQLDPGQTATVHFALNDRSFAYWNSAHNNWTVAPGCYGVSVGSSSADLPLTGTLARLGASCGAGALALNAPDHSSSAAVLPDTPVVTLSNPG
jgi:beta-glucosidase